MAGNKLLFVTLDFNLNYYIINIIIMLIIIISRVMIMEKKKMKIIFRVETKSKLSKETLNLAIN